MKEHEKAAHAGDSSETVNTSAMLSKAQIRTALHTLATRHAMMAKQHTMEGTEHWKAKHAAVHEAAATLGISLDEQ